MMKMSPGRRTLIEWLFVASTLIVVAILVGRSLTPAPPIKDGAENVRMAYNLYQYGVISSSDADQPNPPASSNREPLFPIVLAGVMALVADPETVSISCLMEGAPECRPLFLWFKAVQLVMLLSLAVLTLIAAKTIIGGRVAPNAAFLLVAFHGGFWNEVERYYTEIPAAIALLVASYGLYLACTRRHYLPAAMLSGLGLGGLILIKAVFFYILPALLFGGALAWWQRRSWRAAVPVLVVTAVAYTIGGAWVVRNHLADGDARIAGRGVGVLAKRADYDTMAWREVPIAVIAFTPVVGHRILERFFAPEDYVRFVLNRPESYRQRFQHGEGALAEAAGSDPTDAEKQAAAVELIKQNWMKHVVLTAVFAYRGVFPPPGPRLNLNDPIPLFILLKTILYLNLLITPFLVPSMLVVAIIALFSQRLPLFLFLLPSLYSFAIHAVATHYYPRYTAPLVPCLAIVAVWLVALAWARWQSRRAVSAAAVEPEGQRAVT